MSNSLAIATVTAVLKNLLQEDLNAEPRSFVLSGPAFVSALAPDLIKHGENDGARLNLFLYQVMPNAGWRNVGLPSVDQLGDRLTNPPLALDLYYLLTAYGEKDLEAEILLGYAMQVLHESPVLSREKIRAALKPADPSHVKPLETAFKNSGLADQLEQIKVSPHSMATEETSKLWAAIQSNYRPSVAYHVSVVLIEGERGTRSPLPVLTRGQRDPVSGRDQGVAVQANLLPPFPTLQEVVPSNRQPAVRMGEVLSFSGHHLAGDQVFVRFRHARTNEILELSALASKSETGFQVQIPPAPPLGAVAPGSPLNPDNWLVGVYGVSAVIQRAGQADRVTNELPLALAPSISVIVTPPDADGKRTFTVTVKPKVWQTQKPVLVIGDRELAAQPIAVAKTDTLEFVAKVSDLPTGSQWVRLRLDGIESLLIDRTKTPPIFDPSQQVTL